MKRLIVPVDFSEESIVAIEHAIVLANQAHLCIRLVHVKKKKGYYFGFSVTHEEFPDEQIEKNLNDIMAKYKPTYNAGGFFDYVIKHGSISHEILTESEESDVYAICTGLQGNSSLKDFLVGTNAYRVIAGAKLPVFTIRKGMDIKRIHKILMPIDDSAGTRIKVPIVSALAKEIGATVVVLALSDTAFDEINFKVEVYAKQAVDYLEKDGIATEYIESFDVELVNSVNEIIRREQIDMLAFMSEMTDDPIGQILSSPVRSVLNNAICPLLCVPIEI